MDIILYKEDIVSWKQGTKIDNITLADFKCKKYEIYQACKIIYIDDDDEIFVLKDRTRRE